MNDKNSLKIFWGCFIALITTSMVFSTRIGLVYGPWSEQFNLDGVQEGALFGAGIWPFAISIILFSLVIDKIGYKVSMIFSFVCYAIYGAMAIMAYNTEDNGVAYPLLLWGSIICALGNGTVEAFINPVVATIFKDEKTKWLNILHAGWPAGLVVGGLTVAILGETGEQNWLILVGAVIIPAIIFLIMLIGSEFPVNERVASGTSYREMLAEFGVVCAFISAILICKQFESLGWWNNLTSWILAVALTAGYGAYARSLGSPILIVLVLLMIPLAITELGTDGWITSLMEAPLAEKGWPAILVLVYTSAIMMVLRFNVGPIVKIFTPVGLLAVAAVLAILGLFLLSFASGLAFIFIAATVYGLGKAYFWPTMLGLVAEQSPRGGALTLNAIAGIGMLSVGILGGPLIGFFQESNVTAAVEASNPELLEEVTHTKTYILGDYIAIDNEKLAAQPEEVQTVLAPIISESTQRALANIIIFPVIMLVGYIGLFLYFRSKGGYKPVQLDTGSES